MATRALTMSNSVPSVKRPGGFTLRLIALLMFVAGITLWAYMTYQTQRVTSKPIMTVFMTVMMALAAGLGARFLFYARNWFVRLITGWSSLILGLFLLGYITNWKMGFGPVEFWRKNFDWMEMAHLGGGMAIVLFALMVWWHGPAAQPAPYQPSRRRRSSTKRPAEHSYERPRERPVEREYPQPRQASPRTTSQAASSSAFPSRRSQPQRPLRLKVATPARAMTRSTPRDKVVVGRLTKKVRSSRLRKLFQRTPELQISVYEEHRCPFCLEDVKRNDPRGVKECSVCHTLHHADCWDITGMCQVPHLNS